MKQLRVLRIFLAMIFLVASVAAVTLGCETHPMAALAERSQVIMSAFSITAGASLVWLLLTLLFGRVYCSSICPVGTLSDIAMRMRRPSRGTRHPFRYRHPSRTSLHVVIVYVACLLIGLVGVPFIIEPWNIMRNVSALWHPESVHATWINLGLSAAVGFIAGLVALLLVLITSFLWGRRFCTDFCPVGIMMGYVSNYSLYHIEIDRDKCISCGKCEDVCRSSCIKTVSRYVDNSRCVRCLDCIAQCPNDAIRFQIDRNRPATPLMMRKKANKTT